MCELMIKRKTGMWEGGGGGLQGGGEATWLYQVPPLGVDVVLDFSPGC